MRKRRWVVLAAFVAGCGGGGSDQPSTPATVTIRFLRHDNPNYVIADKAFFAEYERTHPNVKILDDTIDFQALGLKLTSELKTNSLAYDLLLIPPSLVCGFKDNITDVPDYVSTLGEAENTFFKAPLAGSICDGKLKGLPVEYNLEYGGVVVNTDKYRARFGDKMPGWATWDAFIKDASALTEYDEQMKPRANGLDIAPEWPEPVKHLFLSQILQRGGEYWDKNDPGLFNFETQEAHDSLAEMVKWLAVDKVMFRELVPAQNTSVPGRLAHGATGYGWGEQGKPLAVIGYLGTWGVPSTVAQLPAGTTWHYEFVALPPMVGTEHKFVQNSGWAFAVPSTSKNQAVAWDIASSLALSPDAMRKWSAVTAALPALKANGTPAVAAAHPSLMKVQGLLEPGQWVGYIPAAANDTALFAMVNNFFAAAAGTKTVDAALEDMQTVANKAIMDNRGN